ncbi:D-sedoheptulose 7-phosphate isomerase [bacterium]|nr:D-sedoheptulose 7-phosphate isomerase [bacterium]
MEDDIRAQLAASIRVKEAVAADLTPAIAQAAALWGETLRGGGLIAFCGNGGSAADCQHLAGELVSRFRRDRPAYRGLALSTDTSILTAIGNDFGYERVFARQVEGLMRPGDLLVALSTSGTARNCVLAVEQARSMGVATMALTGASGGALKPLVDLCLCVPSSDTPRIQEAHITIGHILCDLVEAELSGDGQA